MQFKQYPSYKPSGVEWLGDVPEHWQQKPIWSLFKRIKRTNFPTERLLSVYRDYGVIPKDSRDDNHNRASEDLTPYQLVCANDLVINKMKAWQGSIAISELRGIVSPAYYIYQPKAEYHSKYIHFLIRSAYYIQSYKNYSKGIRVNQWDLESEAFTHIDLLLPSLDEQQKIVAFLDTETTRIDNLIAKQEKLIELLEEQRKSIISHAVTKGLNPNAPMKDSGVEWLGEVPEHWEVFQLKSAIKGWRNGKWGNEPAAENNICCVRVADFDRTKGVINTTKLTYRNYHGENISECILDENSILIERSGGGEKQLVGATVVNTLKQTAVCSNFISLLNINPNRVNIFFLQKCFENLYTRKVNEKSIKQTSGIQNLDLKQYLQNNIAYPSLDEQKSIVSYLDAECKKIDLLVDKQYQLIRKLKNYRTSIISHAVTGKIDVREFGA